MTVNSEKPPVDTCVDTLWIVVESNKMEKRENDTKTGVFWWVFHTIFAELIPWIPWIPFR